MGAANGYCRPVVTTRLSTWLAHTNRGTPSTEPGVDYYVPTGTPIRAASSGVVVDVGGSIYAATGRYVTIDLDDGRRVRYLHLLRSRVSEGERVKWGQEIAYSGASGYGSDLFGESSRNDAFWNNTGGDHVHMTLWAHQAYKFGRYATLDPEQYMASNQGGNSVPVVDEEEGIDMAQVRYVHRVEPGYDTEWMIVGMEVPGGYQTTTDEDTAVGWGAVYGTDKGDSWKALSRKRYIKLQSSAADLHRRWVTMQKAIRS